MRVLGLAAMLSSALVACTPEGACSDVFVYGLSVSVLNGQTGAPVCDATVTASDGSFSTTLELTRQFDSDGGFECAYLGAGERGGTYALDVKVGAAEKKFTDLVVNKGVCHVQTRRVTVTF